LIIKIAAVAVGGLLVATGAWKGWRSSKSSGQAVPATADAAAVQAAILLLAPLLDAETRKAVAVQVALSLWATDPKPVVVVDPKPATDSATGQPVGLADLARQVAERVLERLGENAADYQPKTDQATKPTE
jgi:hypothetical protein